MSTRTETPTARPAVDGVKGARILIVESRYYAEIADALIEGAEREIGKNGAVSERVVVPGAFEIPGAIALAADHYDGFVALGCVIVTVDTMEQAKARAFTNRGDKGGDAAHACLAMVALGRRWRNA